MTESSRARPTGRLALTVLVAGTGLAALMWAWLRQSDQGFLSRTTLEGVALVAAWLVLGFTLAAAGVAWRWEQRTARGVQRREETVAALEAHVKHLEETQSKALFTVNEERQHLAAQREELALREDQWRILQAQVAVVVTDGRGLILDVSAGYCTLSGYTRQELLGASFRTVSSGHQPRAFWSSFWAELQAGRVWRGVMHNKTKMGEPFWTDTRVTPVFDAAGALTHHVSVGVDISSDMRRQRELAHERDQLATIVDGMRAGTWEWRYQVGDLRVNRRFLALLGLPAGTGLTWPQLRERMHAADLDRIQTALSQHLSGHSPLFDVELRLRGADADGDGDAEWSWCHMRGAVVQRTPSGEPLVLAGTLISIDERRQAEEHVRVQRLISDRAQRLAQVGGFELRWADRQLIWTEQCFHLHDLAPGVQPTWEQALAYVHVEDREHFRQAIAEAVEGVYSWDMEVRLVTALGREILVRVAGDAEYDDGGPVRVVGVFQDVGTQRALEQGIRRQQRLLRAVLENLPMGLSVFGPDRKLIAYNPALLTLLDLPADLLVEGRTEYDDIVRFNKARGEYGEGDEMERAVARMTQMAWEPVPHQFERTRPNGLSLDVRGAPMPDGGMLALFIDISERKRAEETVRAQEHFLRLVADAVPGRISYWTDSGRCVFANRAYAAWLGQTPEALIGLTVKDLWDHAWVRAQRERLKPLFKEGRALRFEHEDGKGNTLLVYCEPDIGEAPGADGNRVRGVVTMALDISELKAVQRETEQLNALLAIERDRANAASEAKSQFLATISHEIRTPMNVVLGMLRLMRKTALANAQGDYVSKAEAAARSLLALLNDVLDFSKIEADKLELERRPFQLDDVLRELAVIMSEGTAGKPIELVFDLDPALPERVVGDQLRLSQVLINLAGNAVKFTSSGTVTVAIRGVNAPGEPSRLRFAVRDSGIGIAQDKLAHIFEGFTQAESSTTRRYGGTGLGLAISQRLVHLMGGELHVHSELGRGSEFAFDLELPLESAPSQPLLSRMSVLLVEPHEGSRTAIVALMQACGVTVQAVPDCEAARHALAADPGVDAVWVAAQLPTEDGWDCGQTLRQLRASGQRPLRWVLAGTADQRERVSGHAQGPDGFVVKPVCATVLREALVGSEAPAPDPTPQSGSLAGLRLLVVEDNPNNQQVAKELLEHEGARVVLADDGAQSLQLLREQRFDLVLMDMQMPVMDGLSATRAIRNDLGLTRLPIVAMTANAAAGDREACLAAGMNAHVGKPFDLDALVALVRQKTRRDAEAAPVTPPVRSLPTRKVPGAQQQRALARGLDLQAGMDRFLGRTELFLRTARSFAAQAQGLPEQLRAWMAASPPDVQAAQQALHSFKGLAATLACEGLAHWGKVGEQRTRAGQALEAEWLASFETQLVDGLAFLLEQAQWLHEPPPENAAPPDPQPQLLRRLRQLVDAHDPAAAGFLAEQRTQLEPWLGADLAALDTALANRDFAAAQAVWPNRHEPGGGSAST